jgi:guanylate kinase
MWNKALLQSMPRGRLFVISAPAGAGKTTLAQRLVKTFPSIVQVPSVTTRPKRVGEVEGVDYHFVSREEFAQREASGEFLEHIELHGNLYATSKQEIEGRRTRGQHVVLVIDTRGALVLKKFLDPVLIFVKPPSFEVLKERLVRRGSEDEQTLQRRLQWAKNEMADEPQFQYSIVNDQLDAAFDVLASIVVAESHKIMR